MTIVIIIIKFYYRKEEQQQHKLLCHHGLHKDINDIFKFVQVNYKPKNRKCLQKNSGMLLLLLFKMLKKTKI